MTGCGWLVGLQFAEEKAEAGEREANAHQAKTGADPRQEGALGGKVGAGVFEFAGHGRTWMGL